MQPNDPAVQQERQPIYLILLTVIAVGYSAWILSLPLFPTQDGPMHLYFTHVLQALLSGHSGIYANFYYVRHILPPYSLYYYMLMILSSAMPLIVADKVVICLYVFSFAFGFRYLARCVGPNGDAMALLATPLILNWPLGMGFVNFCLSTSFALWALGLWFRFAARRDAARRIAFIVLAYVIMLTHPVPLLAVLGVVCAELAIRLVLHLTRRIGATHAVPGFFPSRWISDAVCFLLASGTLAYVKLFTTANVLKQVHLSPKGRWRGELMQLKGYVLLHSLTAFAGRSPLDAIYRLLFYALLAVGLGVAASQLLGLKRRSEWSIAHTWSLLSIALLAGFPLIPNDLNNSAYFAARLVLYVWIAALLAASGLQWKGTVWQAGTIGVALLATIVTLVMGHRRIDPIARQIALVEQSPVPVSDEVGVLMHAPDYQLSSTITYDPYFWSGVRVFRRTGSILYNTPWLDLSIIPLGPRDTLPTYTISPNILESPPIMSKEMDSSPSMRSTILEHVQFAVVSSGRGAPETQPDSLLQADDGPDRRWQCNAAADYSLCLVEQRQPASGRNPSSSVANLAPMR